MFRFDLDRPIMLVPGPTMSQLDVEALDAAATAWRLAFGIPFVDHLAGHVDQRITVDFDDLACVSLEGNQTKGGQYTPALDAQIALCPVPILERRHEAPSYSTNADAIESDVVFQIATHELGHASGIFTEGSKPGNVMTDGGPTPFSSTFGVPVFGNEDRRLLFDALGSRSSSCGEHLVRVYTATDPAGAPSVDVRCDMCPPDPFEPNDDAADAAMLGPGEYDAALCGNDRDYYVVGEAVGVTVTLPTTGSLYVMTDGYYKLLTTATNMTVASATLGAGGLLTIDAANVSGDETGVQYHLSVTAL
jgi:hypothetical protein